MFTFPTRLASAWNAESLEINLPGYQLQRKELAIAVRAGSTQYRPSRKRTLARLLSRGLPSALEMPTRHVFDARFDSDGNIAHVLLNIAPAVLHAKEIFAELAVILRHDAASLAKEAYRLLGVPVICTDRSVSANIVTGECGQGVYEPWYRSVFGELQFEGSIRDTPERVFISRKKTRRLLNEDEIEHALSRYGFHKVYFENTPLTQQWSIARNVKAIVGIHGAALSSLVFNRTGVKVLELFHPGYVTTVYRHVTNAVGGVWCGVAGQMPENIIRELDIMQRPRAFAESAIRIDLHSLTRGLDHLRVT